MVNLVLTVLEKITTNSLNYLLVSLMGRNSIGPCCRVAPINHTKYNLIVIYIIASYTLKHFHFFIFLDTVY